MHATQLTASPALPGIPIGPGMVPGSPYMLINKQTYHNTTTKDLYTIMAV